MVLFTTETLGSFAQYGLQSILVLALASTILLPGAAGQVLGLATLEHWIGGGPNAQAALLAGLFGGFIFAAPMVGGVIADRVLGHTRSVVIGLGTLTVGLAMLVARPLFLFGLLTMIVGFGLAGTTKAQLGALYAQDDPRRSNGFQLYSLAPSIAVLFAPLVCGSLGQDRSWSLGFAAAAAGGLLALIAYVAGFRVLRSAFVRTGSVEDGPLPGGGRLSRRDWLLVGGLFLLLPVLALDCIGNMEIFDGYLLWARQHYSLRWDGHEIPVSWLLSFDAFISMGATAVSVAGWTWLERRGRPVDDLWKITMGTVLCVLAVLVLAAVPNGRVGLGWALAFHTLNDFGNTNTYMVSMAMYSRLAPAALRATITNACALQIFLANMVVAQLASRLDALGSERFWLIHAALIGLSAVILAIIATVATILRTRRVSTGASIVHVV